MATTNDDTAFKITLVKSFAYRGQPEEYSNSYHLTGDPPDADAAWETLVLQLMNAEKVCYPSTTTIVRGYGYEAGHNQSVYVKDLAAIADTLPGTLETPTAAQQNPGDAAVWVRWMTPDFTSRGKRIYLRKYFHPAVSAIGNADNIWYTQQIALSSFATSLTTGTTLGTHHICGPKGAIGSTVAVGPYVTTRTLKRRGKRPPS